MNPADRLIVALDVPVDDAFDLVRRLRYQANNFKLGVGTFLSSYGFELARFLVREGAGLMVDLKLYDTRDTVRRTMEIVAKLGAHWVTVHADCCEHARGFQTNVLAVGALTNSRPTLGLLADAFYDESGFVCHPRLARHYRGIYGPDKTIVCPGIRPTGIASDNHKAPSTPGDAIRNGADYIVVGRPIYAAPDPVTATRAITLEIEAAARAGCPARDEGAGR